MPSERAEIQVRTDRATGAGELVKFGQPVWYRFSFKIAGDWPRDVHRARSRHQKHDADLSVEIIG